MPIVEENSFVLVLCHRNAIDKASHEPKPSHLLLSSPFIANLNLLTKATIFSPGHLTFSSSTYDTNFFLVKASFKLGSIFSAHIRFQIEASADFSSYRGIKLPKTSIPMRFRNWRIYFSYTTTLRSAVNGYIISFLIQNLLAMG